MSLYKIVDSHNKGLLRNLADAKHDTIDDYSLFSPVWLAQEERWSILPAKHQWFRPLVHLRALLLLKTGTQDEALTGQLTETAPGQLTSLQERLLNCRSVLQKATFSSMFPSTLKRR